MSVIVMQCKNAVKKSCKSQFQDMTHGENNRVFNLKKPDKNSPSKEYTCTVCGTVQTRWEGSK